MSSELQYNDPTEESQSVNWDTQIASSSRSLTSYTTKLFEIDNCVSTEYTHNKTMQALQLWSTTSAIEKFCASATEWWWKFS